MVFRLKTQGTFKSHSCKKDLFFFLENLVPALAEFDLSDQAQNMIKKNPLPKLYEVYMWILSTKASSLQLHWYYTPDSRKVAT